MDENQNFSNEFAGKNPDVSGAPASPSAAESNNLKPADDIYNENIRRQQEQAANARAEFERMHAQQEQSSQQTYQQFQGNQQMNQNQSQDFNPDRTQWNQSQTYQSQPNQSQPYQNQPDYAFQPGYANSNDMQQDQTSSGTGGNVQPKNQVLAIVGMVFGILSVLCCWLMPAAVVFGIIGIICSVFGMRKHESKGMWLTGMITGAIGVICGLIIFIIFVAAAPSLSSALQNFISNFDSHYNSGGSSGNPFSDYFNNGNFQ